MRVVVGLKIFYITSFHQAISSHSRAICPHRPAAAVCLGPHAMADRAMWWRTVGEVRDHAAADRGCKGPCRGPRWRKCGFYPPANPVPRRIRVE